MKPSSNTLFVKPDYTWSGYQNLRKHLSEAAAIEQLEHLHMQPQKTVSARDIILGTYLYNYANRLTDETEKLKLTKQAAIEHKSFYAINALIKNVATLINAPKTDITIDQYLNIVSSLHEWMNITKTHHGTPGFILCAHASLYQAELLQKLKSTIVKTYPLDTYHAKFLSACENAVIYMCGARQLEPYSKEAIQYAYPLGGLEQSNAFGCKDTTQMIQYAYRNIYLTYSPAPKQSNLTLQWFETAAKELIATLPKAYTLKSPEDANHLLSSPKK
jgi:Family of unknown function (DUF5630)